MSIKFRYSRLVIHAAVIAKEEKKMMKPKFVLEPLSQYWLPTFLRC